LQAKQTKEQTQKIPDKNAGTQQERIILQPKMALRDYISGILWEYQPMEHHHPKMGLAQASMSFHFHIFCLKRFE